MTKAEQIIEKLGADKSCKGCQGCTCDSEILIGDCLEAIEKEMLKHSGKRKLFIEQSDLLRKWKPCGFTKSLQELLCWHDEQKYGACSCEDGVLKEASALIEFLYDIFITE